MNFQICYLFLKSEYEEIGLLPIRRKELPSEPGRDLFKCGFQGVNSGLEALLKERWQWRDIGSAEINYWRDLSGWR